MRGVFVAFEGANGVGKTTVINGVYSRLQQDKIDAFITKEPSDSKIGILSREIADQISGKPLACLVAADRFYHVENVIMPEIYNGKLVLCDRNILSAFVFNKMDNLSYEYTEKLYEGLIYPDVVILLYASPSVVHKRLMQRNNLTRYEKEKVGFEQQIIDESVEYLEKRDVKVYKISTEVSIGDTITETYNIIKKYI